jgi:hypothetical protein
VHSGAADAAQTVKQDVAVSAEKIASLHDHASAWTIVGSRRRAGKALAAQADRTGSRTCCACCDARIDGRKKQVDASDRNRRHRDDRILDGIGSACASIYRVALPIETYVAALGLDGRGKHFDGAAGFEIATAEILRAAGRGALTVGVEIHVERTGGCFDSRTFLHDDVSIGTHGHGAVSTVTLVDRCIGPVMEYPIGAKRTAPIHEPDRAVKGTADVLSRWSALSFQNDVGVTAECVAQRCVDQQ